MRSRGKNIDNLRSVYQRAHDDDDDDEVETRFASPSMRNEYSCYDSDDALGQELQQQQCQLINIPSISLKVCL